MKEIKFRAFVENDIIEGRGAEMYQVTRIDWDDTGIVCAELYSSKTQTFHILEAKWFKLIEYTGLKDKNGKEGYRKDIAEEDNRKFTIEWLDEEAQFVLIPIGASVALALPVEHLKGMEIIGNAIEGGLNEQRNVF